MMPEIMHHSPRSRSRLGSIPAFLARTDPTAIAVANAAIIMKPYA